MHAPNADLSIQRLARTAGALGVFGILAGAFDMGYVHATVMAPGDAATTAQWLVAHAGLVRLGLLAHVLLLICNVPNEVLDFVLFRSAGAVLAAMAMAAGLVGTAVESVSLLGNELPLHLLSEAISPNGLHQPSLPVLTYMSLRMQDQGVLLSFVFYGLDEMLVGWLVWRSRLLPPLLGALLGLSGLCYLLDGLLAVAAPEFQMSAQAWLLIPCPIGEGLFALWLLIRGINLARWRELDGCGGLP